KMTRKGITYIQYCCPFFNGPRPCELICPVDHPKFTKQKGCNYLWRITDNPRDHIPYGTEEFKAHYNRRTAVERVFSRLLSVSLQQPAVRGIRSIQNHCIISDIAVLLVALAAHHFGYTDKARYVKTLIPNMFS
ncbi:MAG: DDE transposase, partial [Lentisphaeria bacterium]